LQDSIIAFASSLIIATPFLLAMLALHYVVPEERRFWTHAAVLMAVIYTTYNTLNYVVQLNASCEWLRVLVETGHGQVS
jgi:hypothetical protein